MITTYRILTYLLYPFLIILIYARMFSKKEHSSRFKEKIFPKFFNVKRNYNLKLIWFHAASIGEFKSIIPIVKELNNRKNKFEFLITTATLSSSYLVEREFGKANNIHHRFFPIDIKFLAEIFLRLWKPAKIFLVEAEIWPNLIFEAKEKKISIALLNARLTKKSFNRWSLISHFGKQVFSKFDLCICSNSETSTFLEKLDAKKIYKLGNLKLINTIDLKKISNLNEEFLQRNRFWFAASTHKGEEALCLNTHLKLKEKFEKLFTIIAPRHIERVPEIKKEIEKIKSGEFDKLDNPIKNAPHTDLELSSDEWKHKYSREEAAYPSKHLKRNKFWPPVARVDNVYGDKNIFCTCPSMDDFKEDAA